MATEPQSWPAKDPDAVLDYLYTIPLDDTDSVSTYAFTRVSGTVAIDSESRSGAAVTAFLSGGVDGETSIFKIAWTTAGGRDDERYITLPVAANDIAALALTGYAKPSPAHLMARYPAFAAVPLGTIRMWLADAERFVDHSWPEGDYAAALMSLAAHNMALAGIGGTSNSGTIPAGVTRFKSGNMDVAIADAVAVQQSKGGYQATLYGQEFARMQRRNFAGPRLVSAPAPACAGPYGYCQ